MKRKKNIEHAKNIHTYSFLSLIIKGHHEPQKFTNQKLSMAVSGLLDQNSGDATGQSWLSTWTVDLII